MGNLMEGCISFVIVYRFLIICDVDLIFVMNYGSVIE